MTSRPDRVSASLAARKQKTKVQVADLTTPTSQTWANPDGTFTTTRSAAPVRAKVNGNWLPLDATLTPNGDGSYSPRLSAVPLTLSGGGAGALAAIGSSGTSLAMSWPEPLPKPSVTGDTATYAVLPGVDLQLKASPLGGFSEVLVVKDAQAARNPKLATLHLATATQGVTVAADPSGTLVAKDAKGATRFAAPQPTMWDSATTAPAGKGGPRSHDGRESGDAFAGPAPSTAGPSHHGKRAAIPARVSRDGIDLTLDQAMLTAPDLVFPLYADPSWQPVVQDAPIVHALDLMSSYAAYDPAPPVLDVGNTGWFGTARSFLQLDTSAFAGEHIVSAQLTVNESTSQSPNTTTVQVWDTTGFTSSTTWATQPTLNDQVSSTGVPGGTTMDAPASNNYATHQNYGFDVTKAIANAAAASATSWNIGLVAANETDSSLWKEFITPELTVTYNSVPSTPTSQTFTPEAVTGGAFYSSSATPTLSATTADPDGGQVAGNFEVWAGNAANPVTKVASGTSADVTSGVGATWKTPALADGTYEWRAQTTDGLDVSPWSGWQVFTVDAATPHAQGPSVTSTAFPAGTWTQNTSGTVVITPASANTSAVQWQLDGGAATTVNTTGAAVSVPLTPGAGLHTLTALTLDSAGAPSNTTGYTFGAGAAGISSPADKSQTATTFTLAATAPPGAANARFQYRAGTSGTFGDIPTADVKKGAASISWPVATSTVTGGVSTPQLTWNAAHTLPTDGPVQVQALFTDASGNTLTSAPVTVTMNRLSSDYATTSVGPVGVGLQTGNASLSTTDVSVAGYRSGLAVSRGFNSINPAVPSVFGPGWVSSLPVLGTTAVFSSLTDNTGYALLTAADGTTMVFNAGTPAGGSTPYTGQGSAATTGLTLTRTASGFTLVDPNGTSTVFTAPDAGQPARYVPATVTQSGTGRSTSYTYSGGKLVLVTAPDPLTTDAASTAAACPYPVSATTWSTGCRGLSLSYDPTTGNLAQVSLVAVDGAAFSQTPVAAYGYDANGRLSGEWDPRITPHLVTQYGYDSSGRIVSVSPAQDQSTGALKPWTISYDTNVADADYGKVTAVGRTHGDGTTAKTTIVYRVPLSTRLGGPVNMTASDVAKWAQTDVPASAVAIFPPTHVPATPVAPGDWHYAHLLYYDAAGRQTNDAIYGVNNQSAGYDITTTEHDANGNVIRELTAQNQQTALQDPNMTLLGSVALSKQLDTEYLYAADGTTLTDSYGPAHAALASGTVQTVRTHTHSVYNEGAPATGGPYHLLTTQTLTASLGTNVPGTSDVDARTTAYRYGNGSDNSGWTLGTPLQTVTDPAGLAITRTTVYNTNPSLYNGEPLKIETRQPSAAAGGTAGDTVTVYYTAGANPADAACGNQPNWADLPCKTAPAAQPGTAGLPDLPVTQYTYNVYLQPLVTTQKTGAVTRTTSTTYDGAGRPATSAITTTGDNSVALPTTTLVYSPSTGAVTDKQTVDANNNVTADLKTGYDDFGQTTGYTDADGAVTTYTLNLDGSPKTRSDSHDTFTYSYEDTSGRLTQINESADSLSLSGTYNYDGQLVQQMYVGNWHGNVLVFGKYTYDSTGMATKVVYSDGNWSSSIADTITPNAAGDWTSRSVLNSSQTYTYDGADRLTGVADTLAGQCTTRGYGYDADSNRVTATSAAPAANGSCQTSSQTSKSNTFDAADRLTNSGYSYDQLGRITTTPSVDAGGTGDLAATYFANDLIAGQSQSGRTLTMTLDPQANRVRSESDGSNVITNHYADPSDNPSWAVDGSGVWSADTLGINSQLAAITTSSGAYFQLVNLHGDVMATVNADNVKANDVGPATTATYNEFGAPTAGSPGIYGWLGGYQRSAKALGGQLLMGVRGYNPTTGRFGQVDPILGGGANPYDYAFQNPITATDLSGMSRDGWSCGWVTCTLYLNEWHTQVLANFLNWAAGVFATASAIGFAVAKWAPLPNAKLIGEAIGLIAAIVGGALWALSGWIGTIDTWGHNNGIKIKFCARVAPCWIWHQ